ncbi:MAG: alpha/beta fold hydrolase [Pseudohongiella sp.]|nr:alpha/beta fold hydrolase [Pseudohongiella sp.]MDP2128131.1 alpha/beta fold hydrolase [Pseudohongiella sp.]
MGGHPIFFLHGGPGSHSRAAHRRYFDPDFFDIVQFDQRGCGKSVPAGETQQNDTWALVEDINSIRDALGISQKVSLLGGSWGSTLALAYTLRHPQQVRELILRGVFLGSDAELDWFTRDLARFAPEAWAQFSDGMGENLLESYYQAVHSTDQHRASVAARRWAEYEMQLMRISSESQEQSPLAAAGPAEATPTLRTPELTAPGLINSARVQLHFLKHQCFLADSPLLDAAQNIHVPVTIVQGRLDLVCPPITAYQLSERLPHAKLRMVSNAGHSALSGSLALALREEVDGLRDRLLRSQTGGPR